MVRVLVPEKVKALVPVADLKYKPRWLALAETLTTRELPAVAQLKSTNLSDGAAVGALSPQAPRLVSTLLDVPTQV